MQMKSGDDTDPSTYDISMGLSILPSDRINRENIISSFPCVHSFFGKELT